MNTESENPLLLLANVAGINDLSCPYCHQEFTNDKELILHVLNHVDDMQKICTICKKDYKAAINLKQHVLKHVYCRDIECSNCQKQFKTAFIYQLHLHDCSE